MGSCSISDCERPSVARSWCRAHWKKWRRYGDPTFVAERARIPARERFNAKVDTSGGADSCWPWLGARDDYGYGFFREVPSVNMRKTHRVAWEFANGPIPVGMIVCHRCDNPPCVNPAHLFLGTHQDNMRDRDEKGRNTKGYPSPFPGTKSHLAQLSAEAVRDIRARYSAGGVYQRELAEEYGVSQTQIGRIVRGVHWQRVC